MPFIIKNIKYGFKREPAARHSTQKPMPKNNSKGKAVEESIASSISSSLL